MSTVCEGSVSREELVALYRQALACEPCRGHGTVWQPDARSCESCQIIRAKILKLQCADRRHLETMALDTKPGARIVFSNPLNGWPGDKDAAKKLSIDGEYTLSEIDVGGSLSRVTLVEVPGRFNSVQFRNAEVA